ncbi:hypothetical protein JHK82_012755 [Glycine max]|nr:hypothetical protein JHK86_012771 [Glycine max]KAG5154786.1 hypothetical protein JHK82_012755 [Glycine max]
MSRLSILILLLIVLSFSSALSELCNPRDKQVLLKIKKELGNPTTLSSWLPTTDCCNNWVGVSCDTVTQTYRVDNLDLSDLNLPKPYSIPFSIGNIPYLEFLSITGTPNIIGTIPPTITKLTKLRNLYIKYTNVSGQIPRFLSQIKTLEFLDLSYNKLSGNLPAWLPSLPNLVGISFDGNRISGAIPDSFGYFPKSFVMLSLSRNRLTGKIPATLAKLDVKFVYLSKNMLEGDASLLFGSEKHTRHMYLGNNSFAFDLGKLGLSKTLEGLDLSHNRLYGTLPKGLTSLKDLYYLDVSYNNLCGKIPRGGKLQEFDASTYAHNKCFTIRTMQPTRQTSPSSNQEFTNVFGEILHFLSQIKTLETIIFLYNNFSGNLPLRLPLISNLYRVSFDGNRISATISNSFGSFSEPFKLITLSNNCLTRGILETLAKLVFDFVDLSQNMYGV